MTDIESDLLCQIASRLGAIKYLSTYSMTKLADDDLWVGDMRLLIQEVEGFRFKLKHARDKLGEELSE